jgi:hypothetical protein
MLPTAEWPLPVLFTRDSRTLPCLYTGLGPVPTRWSGSWYKLPEPRRPEGDLEPASVVFVFVFLGSIICRLYNLTLPDATGSQYCRFSVKICSGVALAGVGGGGGIFFHLGTNPLLASLCRRNINFAMYVHLWCSSVVCS